MAIKLVEDDITLGIAFQVNDHAHAPAIAFIANIADPLNRLFAHQLTNAFQQLGLVDLIRQLMHHDPVTVTGFNLGAGANRNTAPPGFKRAADTGPAHDDPARREIRPRHDFHHLIKGDARVLDVSDTGIDNLGRVMRRDIGCHANGNTASTIDQQIGVFRRQNRWFQLGFIIIGDEINSVTVNITEQVFSNPGEARFRVAHCGWRVTIDRPEIALPVHQPDTHGKFLRHAHHAFINRAIAVGVIITHDITDNPGGFAVRLGPVITALHHRIENAAMNRLKPVTNIGESAGNDDAHCVIQIGFPHFLGD